LGIIPRILLKIYYYILKYIRKLKTTPKMSNKCSLSGLRLVVAGRERGLRVVVASGERLQVVVARSQPLKTSASARFLGWVMVAAAGGW
jgi:hypothetical protein